MAGSLASILTTTRSDGLFFGVLLALALPLAQPVPSLVVAAHHPRTGRARVPARIPGAAPLSFLGSVVAAVPALHRSRRRVDLASDGPVRWFPEGIAVYPSPGWGATRSRSTSGIFRSSPWSSPASPGRPWWVAGTPSSAMVPARHSRPRAGAGGADTSTPRRTSAVPAPRPGQTRAPHESGEHAGRTPPAGRRSRPGGTGRDPAARRARPPCLDRPTRRCLPQHRCRRHAGPHRPGIRRNDHAAVGPRGRTYGTASLW